MIHPNALVEPGALLGERTRVWAFAHVLPGAVVGADCNICDHVFIEGKVRIGDRVTIKSGVQLWNGVTLEDDVFVGPNATFTNDHFPRSKDYPQEFAATLVRHGAAIGANATVLAGVVIGPNAMVGAGAVVTRDVPANAIVVGNPARISGYVSSRHKGPIPVSRVPLTAGDVAVQGVRLQAFPIVEDLRGKLSFGEFGAHLPFVPRRYFVVYDVPSQEVRGEHAHRKLHQMLVCLKGTVEVLVDDGSQRAVVPLTDPSLGIHVPPMVWTSQYKYSKDALLLVLASEEYDPEDYIRNYEDFLRLRKG